MLCLNEEIDVDICLFVRLNDLYFVLKGFLDEYKLCLYVFF